MTIVRRICHLLGVTPAYIQDRANSHAATMNQMWVKDDEWIDNIHRQEKETREGFTHVRIPLEKEGADIMYSVIAPELKFQTRLMRYAAVIMNTAKVNWTMPATPGWDNSDMAMLAGDNELSGRLKKEHFETAARLRVKRIVMGECGYAFCSSYDMGNRWLGWKMPPVPVIHAVDFYYELLKNDKIKIVKKFEQPVTIQDPCNIVRGFGLADKIRYVVNRTCETIIEMEPHGEHNYCCGAGGNAVDYKNKCLAGNSIKADQMKTAKDKGAAVVITPCHNCHSGIEDINESYHIGLTTKFLTEIVYETMKKATRR